MTVQIFTVPSLVREFFCCCMYTTLHCYYLSLEPHASSGAWSVDCYIEDSPGAPWHM